ACATFARNRANGNAAKPLGFNRTRPCRLISEKRRSASAEMLLITIWPATGSSLGGSPNKIPAGGNVKESIDRGHIRERNMPHRAVRHLHLEMPRPFLGPVAWQAMLNPRVIPNRLSYVPLDAGGNTRAFRATRLGENYRPP